MNMSACNTYGKSVKDSNSIKCNLCQIKAHLKVNYLNYVDTQYIKFSNKTWHCYNCSKNLFSFPSINNFKVYPLLSDKNYCKCFSNESSLALKSPKNLAYLFDEFNSFLSDINITPENIIISKY